VQHGAEHDERIPRGDDGEQYSSGEGQEAAKSWTAPIRAPRRTLPRAGASACARPGGGEERGGSRAEHALALRRVGLIVRICG
jgi:hypothetical protein